MDEKTKKLHDRIKQDIRKCLKEFKNTTNTKLTRKEISDQIDSTLRNYLTFLSKDFPNPSEQLVRQGNGSEYILNPRAMASMLYWYESNEQTRAELLFKRMYGQDSFGNVSAVGFDKETGDWMIKFKHPVEYFLVTLETTEDGKMKVIKNEFAP